MGQEETKTCPKCGSVLFADMDMCFDCLYAFQAEDASWTDEDVPLEAYPEQVIDETCAESAHTWWLQLSNDLIDLVIPVPTTGMLIGRGQACDIVLHARSVSRRHVRLEPVAEGLIVHDMGARNAVVINGQKLTGEGCMREGDTLGVCGTSFVLARRSHMG